MFETEKAGSRDGSRRMPNIKVGSREVMLDAVMFMVNNTSVIHPLTCWSLVSVD
jgi:hypothetical protein